MEVKYSIVLPIHNKEFLIRDVVLALFKKTSTESEFVFIFDGCSDSSERIVSDTIKEYENSVHLKKDFSIKTFTTDNIFEVRSNNFGSKIAAGEFIIFMQDDVIVDENNWNIKLCEPLERFSDVFAVSGNCAHNWEVNQQSKHINETIFESRDNEWCDILNHTEHANTNTISDTNFHIRATCNRAPLAIKKMDFYNLDGLDEIYFPLDMDDHDLMFRARLRLNKFCGFRKIKTISKPEWGGTRNADGSTKEWVYKANHKNTKLFYNRYKCYLKSIIETREI